MKTAELIALLQNLPQDAEIELDIGNPKDSAWTDDVQEVKLDSKGKVRISGWVASDNKNAHMPGYESDFDDEDEDGDDEDFE